MDTNVLKSLKRKAVTGTKWTTISTIISTVTQMIQLIVLTQLLKPSDFGLMGMVMVVIGFASMFADMGISNALIYKQDNTQDKLSSLYWLNIITGIAVFLFIWSCTPLIAGFYNEPRIMGLMFWVALTFPIASLGQQFQVLMQKELRFNWLAKVEIWSAIAGLIVSVVCAFLGNGVMSLVWGQLSKTAAKTFALVAMGLKIWQPSFYYSNKGIKEYVEFGFYQMGERSINYLNSNWDYIFIGKLLGAEALGYYTMAFNLIAIPVNKINPTVDRVAFPIFAKVSSDLECLKHGYFKMLKLLNLINFPMLMGLLVTAPYAIPLIFGKQWIPSIPLVQILALMGLLRSIGNPVSILLLAKGRADLGFKWNVMLMITQIPGIYLGVHFGGTLGAAAAFLILQSIYAVLIYLVLIRAVLGKCLTGYLNSIWPALWTSGLMAIVVFICGTGIALVSLDSVFYFQVLIGLIFYTALILSFNRNLVDEVKKMVFSRF
ncbi:MAG: MOP flippase family protein [Deltaproteobacteria bacterium]